MKLKRNPARMVWALIFLAILFLWIAVFLAEKGSFSFGFKLCAILAVVSGTLAFYLRRKWFLCPHCGEGAARPQLQSGKRHYCPCCGKPFIYDDEVDEF